MYSSIEDLSNTNQNLALELWANYRDSVRDELFEILMKKFKENKMYGHIERASVPVGLEIEFTKAKKLFINIEFTKDEITISAGLLLDDIDFHTDDTLHLVDSFLCIREPKEQAKYLANQVIEFVEPIYKLAQRVYVRKENR